MNNDVLRELRSLAVIALVVGIAWALFTVSDVQAQAPNGDVTISGKLTMTRTDGPQIRLNDTRFPGSGDGATLRGASGGPSTGMVLVERAGGPGGVNLILQPVVAVDSGNAMGFLAYGVGGLGNPTSTNVAIAYYNVVPPYYFIGTSTAGGVSPFAPLRFWSMNHTFLIADLDAAGLSILRVYDPLVLDDANLPSTIQSDRGLVMNRLRQANAGQGGLSWPIDWAAPIWDGQGQVVRNIRMEAFGTIVGGADAPYGIRFLDNAGNILFTIRNDGMRLAGPLLVPAQSEPLAIVGGTQLFTKEQAGLQSMCAKFPNGQVKCFVMQD